MPTVATSFATVCLVTTALLAVGAYSPARAGLCLAGVCVVGCAQQVRAHRRSRPPVLELSRPAAR